MVRSSAFAICLVSVLALNLVECSESAFESKIDLKFVRNMTDFLAANPGIRVQKLTKSESYNVRSGYTQLVHRMGSRINGDRLLTTESSSAQWALPKDVKENLSYPISGELAEVITYLEVFTEQSSNLGNAYVVGGGIAQRRINVVLEAKQTVFWRYRVSIFGH